MFFTLLMTWAWPRVFAPLFNRFTPLEDTVRATLDWHRARPPAERDKLQAGLTLEAEAGLLAKLRN